MARELLLLGLDDAGRIHGGYPRFAIPLAGAVLLDLALAGRIDGQSGRLVVNDLQRTGDPVLDDGLVATGARSIRVKQWVRRLRKGLRGRLVDQLVTAGILRAEPQRALGLFSVTRHQVAAAAALAELHQQLRNAIDAEGSIEPHSAALRALVRTPGLERRLFPERSVRDVRRSLDQIGLDHYVVDVVRAAIRDVRVAILAGGGAAKSCSSWVCQHRYPPGGGEVFGPDPADDRGRCRHGSAH